ncbi:hypothetical protein FH593_20595 (plasmid) [Leptospira interrogans]|uniref:hypothetical protein n=1 Tax=Leptospira interrogans TaxID=173 RepID=UPI0002BDA962|nr:hypothetical protein [Leptospira interrogans]EMN60310.1 hypothetical protein LEP1GSC092_0078 [Leptospira interrogans serovar Pyrogenes str. R168]ULG90727.1 hypothetical protein FH593_20595 [Leptospira interrogans]UML78429.1 hypothetical protein FH583_21350 [Leptospira interrogans]
MVETKLEIYKGQDFSCLLPSKDLLSATAKCEFGTIEGGSSKRVGEISATIEPTGIRLKKQMSAIASIPIGSYRFDVLVERPNVHYPDGKELSIEYMGILKVV